MKRPESFDNPRDPKVDAYYRKQAYGDAYGGFCPSCGEGVEPLLNNDVEAFGKCPYKGEPHEVLTPKPTTEETE